ncbi:glycosyltransferase family 2 protein [Methylocystis echinoides]|uniref:glycosyltransferase family 2 protein n=1 Tax=Methylocystis echinoides TaxID=29468 RepID=UPI002492E9E5|nr:glycosyltransferase [Methylocystis echinoides]
MENLSSPTVSVVLPVYNGQDYIKSAIVSLLRQDEVNEIIVSDDGSTDSTVEIVRSISAPSLRLLINPSRAGQFGNFNRAIREARGNYIQFFSHDDVALKGFIGSQVKAFDIHSRVGLVYSSSYIIDPSGFRTSVLDDEGTPIGIDFSTYLYISSRHGALPPSISSVMISRDVLDEVGPFDDSFAVAGDLEFYNRVAEKFYFARNRQLQLEVRCHPQSVTSGKLSALRYAEEEARILPFYKRHLGIQSYREMMVRRTRTRGADHAKGILRAMAGGNFDQGIAHYRALSKVHSVPACMYYAVLQKLFGRDWLLR